MNYILNSDKKSRFRNAPAPYTEFEVYACMHFFPTKRTGTEIKLLPKIINLLRTIRILNKKSKNLYRSFYFFISFTVKSLGFVTSFVGNGKFCSAFSATRC